MLPVYFWHSGIISVFYTEIVGSNKVILLITARIQRMGKVQFRQVCICTHWGGGAVPGSFPGLWSRVLSKVLSGGYPSPKFFRRSLLSGPFWEVPQSQVLSQVSVPRSFLGGTPVPGSFPGLWFQVLSGGTPVPPSSDWGIPQLEVPQTGVPPWPGQDWDTP